MAKYRVVWEMVIQADSPREAASKAFEYMQLPGTTANIFDVFDESGESCHVDLDDDESWTCPNCQRVYGTDGEGRPNECECGARPD